jgi:LacI family transcriptional regulator
MVDELNSSLMTPVLSGIENVAGEAGYGIIITDSGSSVTRERSNAQSLFQRRVDGIIAMPAPGTTNLDHFRPFVEKNIPVIFLDWVGQFAGSTSIVIDNVLCGRMATQHLIEQGCKRIVYLTPEVDSVMYAQRYAGYREALAERGLVFGDDLLVIVAATEEASEAAAKRIMEMDPLPDGVFATSDLAAAVCIRAFQEQGIRVPQDIAVVGFNNDIIGKLIKPALTTVNYPGKEMGETAARVLLNHLKGVSDLDNISTLTIRTELVIRQSSVKRSY